MSQLQRNQIPQRLRLGLSHLRQHKFKHSFKDTLNPFCSCGLDVDTSTHFFLYCPLFTNQRRTILSTVNNIDSSYDKYTDDSNDKYSNVKYTNDSILTHILLFGKVSLDISANTLILTATMKYIISMNRFQKSLFLVFCNFLLYFHLFNFFPYPYVFFFETIHSYSFSS